MKPAAYIYQGLYHAPDALSPEQRVAAAPLYAKASTTGLQPGDEFVSPEGVEERVEFVAPAFITKTGGGKYRVYAGNSKELKTLAVCDTQDKAVKELGEAMVFMGGMLCQPEHMIKTLFGTLRKQGGPDADAG